MFNIQTIRPEILKFTKLIVDCCKAMDDVLEEFKSFKSSKKLHDKERTETLKPEVLTLDRVAGNFKVKMTEFGLEVPSVMFGAIKSGDEVTVKYDIKK
jgi:hypothetical protein